MAEGTREVSPAEFKQIPLDFIIATPLLTTINAHKIAAQTTVEYVKELLNETVTFETVIEEEDDQGKVTKKKRKTTVPLLAITKVPSLNFDSLSVNFEYNISQVYSEEKEKTAEVKGEVSLPKLLKGVLNINFNGSIGRRTTSEFTSNRSGSMEIKIHVSESPLPAGLDKIITAMTNAIGSDLPKKVDK